MFEILAIIHVVSLAVCRVLPRLEKVSHVGDRVLLSVLAHRSLLLLQEIFVFCSSFHVTIFQSSLIWSSPCICGSHFPVQPGRKVVHLDGEVTHTIHHISLFGVRRFAPNLFNLPFRRLDPLQEDVSIPVSSDGHEAFVLFLFAVDLVAYLTIQLGDVFVFAEPASTMEVDNCFLVGVLFVDLEDFTDVDVRCANHEVVHRHGWELYFVPLAEVWQVDIRPELLRHQETLATELDVGFLVCLVDVVALAPFAVASSHRRVMSHLLSQVLKVIGDKFESLTEHGIEWLCSSAFANGQS